MFGLPSTSRSKRFAQSESEDLTYVVSRGVRPYRNRVGVYASTYGYDDDLYLVNDGYGYGGTDRVIVVDGGGYGYGVNALNKVNAVNYRSNYNTRNYLDSAYIFNNGYGYNNVGYYGGYNNGYGYGADTGYGVFGRVNGWNGGSDYYSYYGYKPISG